MKNLLALMLACYCVQPLAECSPEQINEALDAAGILNSRYDNASWHISDAESVLYMSVDTDDGDMAWAGLVERKSQASIAWINQIHREWRYVQLAIDEDLDLIASFAVPYWGDGCSKDAIDNAKFFLNGMTKLKASLSEYLAGHSDQQGVFSSLGGRDEVRL